MFREYTAQLLLGRPGREYHVEFIFKVDIDMVAKEPIDIYADRHNYGDFPAALERLTWKMDRNPQFIHVVPTDRRKAWDYLQEHAILDDELEALLR